MPTTRRTSSRESSPPQRRRRGAQRPDIAASMDAFRRILRELRLAARKTETTTGLSSAQLFVLSTVAASPGCSVNDIAVSTMTDRSSAAAIVDRLFEQGYVTRERSAEDRRRASIGITARGRRAVEQAPPPATLLIEGLRRLAPAQLVGLARGLVALTKGMGIAHEPARLLFEDADSAEKTHS
ncbi:MAG TPA: MarR family transcriptional regulator [Gemmatimonadaceae bacterium]|jgi:DNA-binding MarR family transcriptional regulator|nr:MarR family transcriptional regulator [Gemmatimonadaceae bacterium]